MEQLFDILNQFGPWLIGLLGGGGLFLKISRAVKETIEALDAGFNVTKEFGEAANAFMQVVKFDAKGNPQFSLEEFDRAKTEMNEALASVDLFTTEFKEAKAAIGMVFRKSSNSNKVKQVQAKYRLEKWPPPPEG